jgi:hypothetical protein
MLPYTSNPITHPRRRPEPKTPKLESYQFTNIFKGFTG